LRSILKKRGIGDEKLIKTSVGKEKYVWGFDFAI
jgi:hypothetical protein